MSSKRRHRRQLGAVPDDQLMDALTARARMLSAAQAEVWEAMAEIGRRPPLVELPGRRPWTPDQVFDAAVEEIHAELRLTRRGARRELGYAEAVFGQPRIAAALAAGEIDRARAIVLAEGCFWLSEEQSVVLLDTVLPGAACLTATALADRVRRVVIALDPAAAERRYRAAIRDRRVIAYLDEDGSATVAGKNLPADHADAACQRIDALAAAAKRAGANARTDQLRAEVFLGLLDGRFHGLPEHAIITELCRQHPRGTDTEPGDTLTPEKAQPETAQPADEGGVGPVARRGGHVRIGLGALLGLDEVPGELAGLGIVPAPVAREVVARQQPAEWRFAILDEHGQLLHDGITRHRPTLSAAETTTETGQPQAAGGIVEVHVPLALLADPDVAVQHPGWARLLADLAQQYADRRPIGQDPDARFPGRRLRRRSETTFACCIGVVCRRPASRCDQDHTRDYAQGGRTDEDNLAPACTHDNQLKNRGWRLVRSGPRTFTWISPLGRRHIVQVDPVAPPLPGTDPSAGRTPTARPAAVLSVDQGVRRPRAAKRNQVAAMPPKRESHPSRGE